MYYKTVGFYVTLCYSILDTT